MPRLLVLANLELSFDLPPGVDADAYARLKERRLLRVLNSLASEGEAEGITGSLERLEYESFSYGSKLEAEPNGYYYNQHEKRAGAS
jgi:hypothetical protein